MGLFQKRDERDVVSGIEIIERTDVPGDLPESDVDLVSGPSAEEIAADTHACHQHSDEERHADKSVAPAEGSASDGMGRPDSFQASTEASDCADATEGAAASEAASGASGPDEPANPYVGVPVRHDETTSSPVGESGPQAQPEPAPHGEREAAPAPAPQGEPVAAPQGEPATLDEAIPDDQDEPCEPTSGAPGGSGSHGGSGSGDADGPQAPSSAGRSRKRRRLVIGIVGALVIIAIVGAGAFALRGVFGPKGIGSPTLKQNQLDTTIATYRYEGRSHDISARAAIESQYSLDTAKNTDGTYTVPQAETILSYVRNQILTDSAKSRKIKVSENEMKEYAQSKLGISDFSQMASRYGVSKDQAKEIIRDNVLQNKLYKKIVGKAASDKTMPDAPTEPSDGKDTTASKEYADYIIKLAGDEWDASKGTWASDKGPYHTALKDQQFTADSATYGQAMTAYYVAYQQYNESTSSASQKWKSFVNDMYAKVDVTFYGIDQ